MSRVASVGLLLVLFAATPIVHAQEGVHVTLPQAIETVHRLVIDGDLDIQLVQGTDVGSFTRVAEVHTTWGQLGDDGVLPFRISFQPIADEIETTIEGAGTAPFPGTVQGIARLRPGKPVEVELVDTVSWSHYAMIRDVVRAMLPVLPAGPLQVGEAWSVQDEVLAELAFPQANLFYDIVEEYVLISAAEGVTEIAKLRDGSTRLGSGPLGPRGDRIHFTPSVEGAEERRIDQATGLTLSYQAVDTYREVFVSYEDGPTRGVTLFDATLRVSVRLVDGRIVGEGAGVEAPARPVQIVMGPWLSSEPPAFAAKAVLEEYFGVDVVVRPASADEALRQVVTGEADLFLDLWVVGGDTEPFLATFGEHVELLGEPLVRGVELGWAVPSYVPIEDVAELNQYAPRFGGRIYGLNGADMMQTSVDIIRHYGLDFNLVGGSELDLLQTIEGAIEAGEWIVFLAYRPHHIFAQYDLRLLNEQEGFWKFDDVWAVARQGFQEDYPEIAAFIGAWELPLSDFETMIYRIQVEGWHPREVAEEWLDARREQVEAFMAP